MYYKIYIKKTKKGSLKRKGCNAGPKSFSTIYLIMVKTISLHWDEFTNYIAL